DRGGLRGLLRLGAPGVEGDRGRITVSGAVPEAPSTAHSDHRYGRRLLAYLRPYWPAVAGAVTLLLLGAALALVGPAVTQRVLADAVPPGEHALLTTLALVFLAALVADVVAEYAQTVLTAWVGQRVMSDLRREV